MNRQIVARLGQLLLIAVFCWCVPLSGAQEKEQEPAKKPAEQVQKQVNAYRLDFSVNEMQDGKKINSRQYSMYVSTREPSDIKIGTRVPAEMKQAEMQYIDVGTRIQSRIQEQDNGLLLFVTCDISSFVDPERAKTSTIPPLRQVNIHAGTEVGLGKPTVIGSVDDPDSKRQFQLEVTATKLK